jgi:hypothetical protein
LFSWKSKFALKPFEPLSYAKNSVKEGLSRVLKSRVRSNKFSVRNYSEIPYRGTQPRHRIAMRRGKRKFRLGGCRRHFYFVGQGDLKRLDENESTVQKLCSHSIGVGLSSRAVALKVCAPRFPLYGLPQAHPLSQSTNNERTLTNLCHNSTSTSLYPYISTWIYLSSIKLYFY